MKKIITGFFLLLAIHATAQTDAVDDTTAKPAITGFGKDDGNKTELKIGKDGGSISSSDGVVTLIFPEDALPKKTNISIQPVENMAPNGNGKGYKMEPSGILFKKSATIVFNYSNEDTANNSQALMNIAMQDENGKWFKLNKTVKDTVAKTITGSIKHFSTYVNFSKAKIIPRYTRLKVGRSIRLKITEAYYDDTDENVITLTPINGITEYPVMNWSVNSIEKGNSTVGFISTSTNGSAIFKAPEKVPAQNPVTVTVREVFKLASNNRYARTEMVSNIFIYDNAYEVSLIYKQDAGQANIIDSGSFAVLVEGDNAKVLRIINNNCVHLHNVPECAIKLINPSQNHGNIHITGIKKITVVPAQPPNDAMVEISFIAAPIIYSTFLFTCKDAKGKLFSATTHAATGIVAQSPAQPLFIKFFAKEGEQKIIDMQLPGGYFKVTVKKIKDE
jgi:hypothetical protein